MPKPTAQATDGLEWVRAVRRDIQREIGQTPRERAAYYQAKDKNQRGHTLRSTRGASRVAA